jgi:hypothetical protein
MTAARIAVIALPILNLTLVAQTARQVSLNIKVTDLTGASVSEAKVEVHSSTVFNRGNKNRRARQSHRDSGPGWIHCVRPRERF